LQLLIFLENFAPSGVLILAVLIFGYKLLKNRLKRKFEGLKGFCL